MPITVECTFCRKSMRVPDAAQGKRVKCSGCGEGVAVPSQREKVTVPAEDPPSSSELIATLDLNRLEDEGTQICPACMATIDAEEQFCSECGADLKLSARATRKGEGRDRSQAPLFFEKAFSTSREFAFRHLGLAFKTSVVIWLPLVLAAFCGYWTVYCATLPPWIFWFTMTLIYLLIPLGWLWTLHQAVMRYAMKAKKKPRMDKLIFDFALATIQGVTTVVWFPIFALPLLGVFGVIGMGLEMAAGVPYGILGGMGLASLLVFCMLPVVMSHMVMPVSHKAWLLHLCLQDVVKTGKAGMYWVLLVSLFALPTLVVGGTFAFFSAPQIQTLVNVTIHNGKHRERVVIETAAEKANQAGAVADPKLESLPEEALPIEWMGLILPAVGLVVTSLGIGVTSLFAAHANGVFTRYLKRDMDLITSTPEFVYVRKETGKEEDLSKFSMKRSSPGPIADRFTANVIDGMIATLVDVLLLAIAVMLVMAGLPESAANIGFRVLAGLIFFAIFVGPLTGPERATPGKKMMGLFVAQLDGSPITVFQAWLRGFVLAFSPLLLFTPHIVAMFREDRRGLHDLAAGTMVRKMRAQKAKKSKAKAKGDDKK